MSSRGPFQLFSVYYKRGEWSTKTFKTENDLREHMIHEMTESGDIRPKLFESIRAAPLEKIVAFWIKRGRGEIENQNGYGCVSIIEGTPVNEDDSSLDGEEDGEIECIDGEEDGSDESDEYETLTYGEKEEIRMMLDKVEMTMYNDNFDKAYYVTKLREFLTTAAPEEMKDRIRDILERCVEGCVMIRVSKFKDGPLKGEPYFVDHDTNTTFILNINDNTVAYKVVDEKKLTLSFDDRVCVKKYGFTPV